MIDRGKRDILGVHVNVIDYASAVENVISAANDRRPYSVSALAVHGVMTGALDPEHRYRLNRFDLVTPDGQPVRWALRLLHKEKLPDRVYGPELTRRVCARAAEKGLSIYLFGSKSEVIEALSANLRSKFSGIVIAGAEPSVFRQLSEVENAELNRRIEASGANILLVGLGCPRQEIFAFEHTDSLDMPILAVGAAFDFIAGSAPQAPAWMSGAGLEWLFRLAREPQRLWRRYILLNPLFSVMVAAQWLGLRKSKRLHEEAPAKAVRFG